MTDSIVEKPYEVLVRFTCEIGEIAGHIRGVSVQMKSLSVDSNGVITGRIDRGKLDDPKDFPQDQLQSLLGDNFVAFNAQLEQAKSDLKDAQKSISEKDSQIASLSEQVAAQPATVSELSA